MKNLFLLNFLLFFGLVLQAQTADKPKQYTPIAVGFWNVENFYDTLNDPLKDDEEFLPGGKNNWNGTRYNRKVDHITDVISQLATETTPDGVAVMGLCEIENRSVLEDIVKAPKLVKRGYKIAHIEGPDKRGVDVALLYNPTYFKLSSMHAYRLVLPTDSTHPTRDQLLVSGKLLGEEIHFIVCHWPSRAGGGDIATQPNRIAAAKLGRKIMDSILGVNPNAKVILMGDLNDDPIDASIRKYLNTTGKPKEVEAPLLFNAMESLFKKGIGTLAYNDAWNLFDQQIMTPALVHDTKGIHFHESHIFNKPFVLIDSGKYRGYLFRTYSGGEYTGGYSDHCAVYSIMLKER